MRNDFQPRRILVIKLRHIGDVLLISPVFQSLREAFPNAELYACVNEKTEAMLATNPLVKGIVAVSHKTLSNEWRTVRKLRKLAPDLVLDFTGSDRSAILARLTGAAERWGYHRIKGFLGRNRLFTKTVRRKKDAHVVEQQADFLMQFGIASRSPQLAFHVTDEDRAFVQPLLQSNARLVHVHPVSRLMEKTWPVAFMADLLSFLADRGLQTIVTASNDQVEMEWVRELQSLSRVQFRNLSGKLSLTQLAAVSERSVLFVGVDSAPLHIAAAVGTPVIGIFGPSSEILWGPWCEKKLVLSREMDCRLPCKMKNTCPHIACLREMTPGMVFSRVDAFLASLSL